MNVGARDVPVLESPRLRLREWRDEDVAAWAEMNADPQVMEFFPGPYARSEAEEIAARIRGALERDGYGWWVLERKDRRGFAGIVALQNVPYEVPFTPAFEIGWRLPVREWGQGFATEGAQAALDYAFSTLGHTEVVALTAKINERSRRVMERLGMTYDPADDFDHPRLPAGHRLRPHVLYRIRSGSD